MIDPIAVYDPVDNLRLGAGYQPNAGEDLVSVSRRTGGSFRKPRALRGCGRMPQAGPRHDVSQLHGHPRGEALHPRPRAPAVGDAARRVITDGWRTKRYRSARSLPLLQGLQDGVPGERRHGDVEGRISGAIITRAGCIRLQHYVFGFMDRWAQLASIAPGLANLPMRTPGIQRLVKSIAGVAPQRELAADLRARRTSSRQYRRGDAASTSGSANLRQCCSGPIPGTTTFIRRCWRARRRC